MSKTLFNSITNIYLRLAECCTYITLVIKMQAFKHIGKSNDEKIYFMTLYSESFKRTRYGYCSVSRLSKRCVDLR